MGNDEKCANCDEAGQPAHHWLIQEGVTTGMYICTAPDGRPEAEPPGKGGE